jgi:hypothetical protein
LVAQFRKGTVDEAGGLTAESGPGAARQKLRGIEAEITRIELELAVAEKRLADVVDARPLPTSVRAL